MRRDFTLLHPEVLDQKCRVSGNILHLDNPVNWEEYRALILPGMTTLSLSNARKLHEFCLAGGAIIATTQLPYQATRAADDAQLRELIGALFGETPEPRALPPHRIRLRVRAAYRHLL